MDLELFGLQVFDQHDFVARFAVNQLVDNVLGDQNSKAPWSKPLLLADRRVTDDEETLLRAVCDALGTPLPPLDAAGA